MRTNEQYPVRVVHFHGVAVSLYEIEGREYLTAEDIGVCLGLAEPRIAVNKIYHRNQEELEPHTIVTKMVTNYPGNPNTRLFDEIGCHLISMFARTREAKEFRLWLARLPRQVRQTRECLPGMVEQISQEAEARGVQKGFCLATDILAGKLDSDVLAWVRWYRRQGLTHEEVGLCLGIAKHKAQELQRRLESLGFKFGKVTMQGRRRKVRDEFARELAQLTARRTSPSMELPGPEQDS